MARPEAFLPLVLVGVVLRRDDSAAVLRRWARRQGICGDDRGKGGSSRDQGAQDEADGRDRGVRRPGSRGEVRHNGGHVEREGARAGHRRD